MLIKSGFITRSIAAAFFGAAVYSQEAQAASVQPVFTKTGGRTTQPIGHYEFCKKNAGECKAIKLAPPINLTNKSWKDIVSVNNTINKRIAPRTDMQIHGQEEVWSYPVKKQGDCEDYVLEKRRVLMNAGVEASNLLITVVRQPNGDGHAVLTVRTNKGDYILDNLEEQVLPINKTPYTYLKRTSEKNAGVWLSINGYDGIETASVDSISAHTKTPAVPEPY